MNIILKELTYKERDIIRKTSINTLKDHYKKKYSVFELSQLIRVLQKSGLTNIVIAKEIGINEESMYDILPIEHATQKTTDMIKENRIDGYKASRLLRRIGDDPRQNEFMETIVKDNMSLPNAEKWITEQNHIGDLKWQNQKKQKEFEEWIANGKKILLANKNIEAKGNILRDIKILNARLQLILNKGI